MAVDVRLIGLCALLAACSAGEATQPAAAAQADATALDRARVGGRELTLVADGRQCAVDIGGSVHRLDLETPCRFLRTGKDRDPWSHNYGEWGAVVLVGGPPAPEGDYSLDVGRTPADRCSNTGRAVIVSGGKVALSAVKTSPLWFCPGSAPDEKYYYGIAHEQAFAQRKTLG